MNRQYRRSQRSWKHARKSHGRRHKGFGKRVASKASRRLNRTICRYGDV
jgi:hypothetical protein